MFYFYILYRKIIYKNDGLNNQPDSPTGYKFVGYDNDTFSEKDGSVISAIGGSGGYNIIEKTYSELTTMITNTELDPGQLYLMTDFQTIYDQPDYSDADTPKTTVEVKTASVDPIILLAISKTEFAKEVWRPLRPKHTLEYDIHFVETEVMGATAKGRITYCKDEFDNETHYDHTVVLLKRYESVSGSGIFNSFWDTGFGSTEALTFGVGSLSNKIEDNYYKLTGGFAVSNNVLGADSLGNNIGIRSNNNTFGSGTQNNTFGNNTQNNTFGNDTRYNTFGNNAKSNTFGNVAEGNTFGIGTNNNTFVNNTDNNTFGDYTEGNTFGDSTNNNTFGNFTLNNTFGYNTGSNTFGNNTQNNNFGNNAKMNTFGNNAKSNTFGNSTLENTFGEYTSDNTFGNDTNNNTFGNYAEGNTFGNGTYNNTFRSTEGNTFGDSTHHNTFGSIEYNTFGNNTRFNTFGNDIYDIDFTITPTAHVYGNYNCNIFKRQDGTVRLSYYDNTDALVVVNPTD